MKFIHIILFATATSFAAGYANAGLILDSGRLIGATDVNVDGVLYTVMFTGGTCVGNYTGCDSDTDFPFLTNEANNNAASALLEQVLIDGPDGLFDSDPELTGNCLNPGGCFVVWPTMLDPNDSTHAFLSGIFNVQIGTDPQGGPAAWPTMDELFSGRSDLTWAVWTRQDDTTSVPAPGAFGLLLSCILVGAMRRRLVRQF